MNTSHTQKIIDISVSIYPGMMVYPGNPLPVFTPERGETTFRTVMTLGTHTGTHLDAPRHTREDGASINEMSLDHFWGPCRILDMTHISHGSGIERADLERVNVSEGERILFKTRNSLRGYERFYDDSIFLSGDAAEHLTRHPTLLLVGIDALSIKKRGSADTRAHDALLAAGIPILEGVDLSKVAAGDYTLCCFPLRLTGLDGSPVRAILLREK